MEKAPAERLREQANPLVVPMAALAGPYWRQAVRQLLYEDDIRDNIPRYRSGRSNRRSLREGPAEIVPTVGDDSWREVEAAVGA